MKAYLLERDVTGDGGSALIPAGIYASLEAAQGVVSDAWWVSLGLHRGRPLWADHNVANGRGFITEFEVGS